EAAERYADGLAAEEEICEAGAVAWEAADAAEGDAVARYAAQAAYAAVGMYDDWGEVWGAWRYAALAQEGEAVAATNPPASRAGVSAVGLAAHLGGGRRMGQGWGGGDVEASAAALLREVFGNPFRPGPRLTAALAVEKAGLVSGLAQAAYEERSLPAG